jgi:hypothetical protein
MEEPARYANNPRICNLINRVGLPRHTPRQTALAARVGAVLFLSRLPSAAARLARRSGVPFAGPDLPLKLPESVRPVVRHLDHALMRNSTNNVGRAGYFAVLNSQAKLGRGITASGFRFDGYIPDTIEWLPGEG